MVKTEYTIVIPFRNEEKNLNILLPRLAKVIDDQKVSLELILVDDFSNDNSLEICKKYESLFDEIYIFSLPYLSISILIMKYHHCIVLSMF